uniref:DUF7950 domain-containing protein n=1 Tax=Cannabis sativa TaxID=3483 RepID=A0A803QL80_CANSA
MEGRDGWHVASFQATTTSNKTIINPVMLRFRPIAPKPVTGGSYTADNNTSSILRPSKRVKRKYVRVRRDINNKKDKNPRRSTVTNNNGSSGLQEEETTTTVTLQLLPEKSDGRDLNGGTGYGAPGSWIKAAGDDEVLDRRGAAAVESWVTVESVTDTCMDVRGLGCTDVERIKNLEKDTCPGFVTDEWIVVVLHGGSTLKLLSVWVWDFDDDLPKLKNKGALYLSTLFSGLVAHDRMNGGPEGWSMIRCAGGAHDKSVMNRIMLRFRPIAPKPSGSGSDGTGLGSDHNNNKKIDLNRSDLISNNNSSSYFVENHEDLPMWKRSDQSYGESDRSRGTNGLVVHTWVTVECVTGTCMVDDNRDFGSSYSGTDMESVKRNLEKDTCPGFISDGSNSVLWVNAAFKRMVVREEGENNNNDGLLPEIRVVLNKYSRVIVPCDLWRMDGGGFAWRLDVEAALTLGR